MKRPVMILTCGMLILCMSGCKPGALSKIFRSVSPAHVYQANRVYQNYEKKRKAEENRQQRLRNQLQQQNQWYQRQLQEQREQEEAIEA